jgi:hypothetical protein
MLAFEFSTVQTTKPQQWVVHHLQQDELEAYRSKVSCHIEFHYGATVSVDSDSYVNNGLANT